MTDEELLELIERARHDVTATNELIRVLQDRVTPRVRSLAPVATQQEMLDAQAELVSRLWRVAGTLSSIEHPWAYLTATIDNFITDVSKKLADSARRIEPLSEIERPSTDVSPEDLAVGRDFGRLLREFRETLSHSQREPFDAWLEALDRGVPVRVVIKERYPDDSTKQESMARRIRRLREQLRKQFPPFSGEEA